MNPWALGGRAFDLLLALAQRRERMVTKQELLDLVWPGLVVEEHNIATQISTLRKLLGAHVIATVPGRGYRFTAPLTEEFGEPAARPAASVPAASAQTHLPRELTPLLGREDDLTALAGLVQRSRLRTLVGAGGMGKSLLAQHLLAGRGGDYAQGVCWVELASVSDAAELPARIAQALGVRLGEGEPLAGMGAAVSSMTILVALDNAEHLLEGVARSVAALLDAAPGLRLIITSQAPLRLAAESVYRVGPLAVPQGPLPAGLAQTFGAVALFVERARGADARFVLSDDSAPAAIELCRQLDGLPLAIELAAVRAPLLGVRQLAVSMQDRLRLLTRSRAAAAPARQQTLRAALEWSHGLLDERERIVFRRMAVVADSASLALIQRVVADEQGALDMRTMRATPFAGPGSQANPRRSWPSPRPCSTRCRGGPTPNPWPWPTCASRSPSRLRHRRCACGLGSLRCVPFSIGSRMSPWPSPARPWRWRAGRVARRVTDGRFTAPSAYGFALHR